MSQSVRNKHSQWSDSGPIKKVPGFVNQISFSLFPTNGTFRYVLETTLADLLLMGALFESDLCFANNVSFFLSIYKLCKKYQCCLSLNLFWGQSLNHYWLRCKSDFIKITLLQNHNDSHLINVFNVKENFNIMLFNIDTDRGSHCHCHFLSSPAFAPREWLQTHFLFWIIILMKWKNKNLQVTNALVTRANTKQKLNNGRLNYLQVCIGYQCGNTRGQWTRFD